MADTIIKEIKEGKLQPGDVITIVKHVAKAVKGDKEAAIEAINTLSRGADGIDGTPDDIIPLNTAAALRALLNNALVGQLVGEFSKKKWCCFA